MQEREKARRTAIELLAKEDGRYSDLVIPESEKEQQELLRALMNLRSPTVPLSADYLRAQDIELQAQKDEKGIVRVSELPETRYPGLCLWQGDITRLATDAIVNAANSALLGCFVPLHRCIDNAIHSAAGLQLRMACYELMQQQGQPESTGSAKITAAFNLPARFVMHTVGPIIQTVPPTPEQEQQLADCYQSCLTLAEQNRLQSLVFCCISTGEFRFPNQRAAEIAVRVVRQFLDTKQSTLQTVVFNVFKDEDYRIYQQLLNA